MIAYFHSCTALFKNTGFIFVRWRNENIPFSRCINFYKCSSNTCIRILSQYVINARLNLKTKKISKRKLAWLAKKNVLKICTFQTYLKGTFNIVHVRVLPVQNKHLWSDDDDGLTERIAEWKEEITIPKLFGSRWVWAFVSYSYKRQNSWNNFSSWFSRI